MFQTSGWELVVVTNQSGIARGYFTEHDLERMHDKLRQMLRVWGVELSAIAYCPHHVDGAVPHLAIPCSCRKPQPGMLLEIAAARDIDLARSWMIGDILDDVEAGNGELSDGPGGPWNGTVSRPLWSLATDGGAVDRRRSAVCRRC